MDHSGPSDESNGGGIPGEQPHETSRDAELVTVYEVEALASDPAKAAHAIAALRRRVKRLIDLVTSDHVRLDLLYHDRAPAQREERVDGEEPPFYAPFE